MNRILIAAVFALAGCSGVPYSKSGAGEGQASADYEACRFESAKATASLSGLEAGVRRAELNEMCMRQKGYR